MSKTEPAGALPAKQARSRESARRIVEAVEGLLKEKPFDQLTMAEIAMRADMTPGAIYRRFESKEALLPAIFDRYRTILSDWSDRVSVEAVTTQTNTLSEAIELIVCETYKAFKQHAHIFRTVHLYARLHPEARGSAGDTKSSFAPLGGVVAHFLGPQRRVDSHEIQMTGHVLISAITERTLYPNNLPSAALRMSEKQFIRSLGEMLAAWITRPRS